MVASVSHSLVVALALVGSLCSVTPAFADEPSSDAEAGDEDSPDDSASEGTPPARENRDARMKPVKGELDANMRSEMGELTPGADLFDGNLMSGGELGDVFSAPQPQHGVDLFGEPLPEPEFTGRGGGERAPLQPSTRALGVGTRAVTPDAPEVTFAAPSATCAGARHEGAIARRTDALARCIERVGRSGVDASGTYALTWTIDASGAVVDTRIEPTLEADAAECALGLAKRIRFAAPDALADDQTCTVTAPFDIAP